MKQLLSHTDRTLKTHLDSCNSISQQLLASKIVTSKFYDKSLLESIRLYLVYFHDFGKATDFFQHRIIKAAEEEKEDKEKVKKLLEEQAEFVDWFQKHKNEDAKKSLNLDHTLGRHSAIGAYFQFSNYSNENPIIELIVLHIIKKHHGNLADYSIDEFIIDSKDKEYFDKQLDNLDFELYQHIIQIFQFQIAKNQWDKIFNKFKSGRKIIKVLDRLEEEKKYQYFFLQHFLFSLLLSADKGDVKVDNKEIIKPNVYIPEYTISNYKTIEFGNSPKKAIDKIRESAYQDIESNIIKYANKHFFSITLPTGMGKTLSAYNAAILLQNQIKETTFRIIYCLPFTSIIDQNESILTDIFTKNNLDETLIAKNHYLAHLKDKYGEDTLSYQESEYLTEGWEQEFIVTTFVQFLESIFTSKNKRLRKFHNMTNAIILLDEVQNVPPKYYPLIEVAFKKMATYFNTKFIFITATQPIIFDNPSDVIELTDPIKVRTRSYFENLERIELNKSLLNRGKIDLEEICTILLEDVERNANKSFLIICNTIKQSQDIYQFLNDNLDLGPFYLSSSILPKFRRKIIKDIQNNTKKNIRQVVISTQVVEAGVDIDLDIVYRDLAPLDSINQSAGRCNRNGVNGTGLVKLFNSGKGQLLYDPTLLSITENIFKSYSDII